MKCKRHVYKTMCEFDAQGNRKGKSGDVNYESRRKRGATPSKPTKNAKKPKTENIIAKEEIRKAYAKRAEERRQKALSVKAAVKDLLMIYEREYTSLYDRRVDFSLDTIEDADRFITNHPKLVGMFNTLRQDILTSDREVVAFKRAVSKSKNKALLYSLDRRY